MATVLLFGPADHGRAVSDEEISSAQWQPGFRYEIIDGRLYVSPTPNLPHDDIVDWLRDVLKDYSRSRPDVINAVKGPARVFVPGARRTTVPEPDVAAYRDYPRDRPIAVRRWQDVSPILVVEVLSEDDPDKDLVRNVDLYLRVPSIREYWIVDPRQDADRPPLLVYRRRGRSWQRPITVATGQVYTTRLLPGLALTVDPLA
jgi:Uma2 family endonuclease